MRQKDNKKFEIMLTKLARRQLKEVHIKFSQNLKIPLLYIEFAKKITRTKINRLTIEISFKRNS